MGLVSVTDDAAADVAVGRDAGNVGCDKKPDDGFISVAIDNNPPIIVLAIDLIALVSK